MASAEVTRVLFVISFSLCVCAYDIPDVKIEVFSPRGFRASIPHDPAITLFVFQGRINRAISKNDVGTLSGEITSPTGDQWVYEDPNVVLSVGDVINYYVFVVAKGEGGKVVDPLTYTVREFTDPRAQEESPQPDQDQPVDQPANQSTNPPYQPTYQSTNPPYQPTNPPYQPSKQPTDQPNYQPCEPTATRLRVGTACAGQVIFEDHFDTLREDVWQIQQFIPVNHPEYPFVSYQRLTSPDPTVSVINGRLRIAPKLQQNLPPFNNESIVSGTLNLFSSCTGSANECSAQAWGASILPPVVSGRVVNKGFAFTYGTVHVRAKLPMGDWIYPEILLEPFIKKYDMSYASGVLKIACARGNRQLTIGGLTDFSNRVLYGGPIMDFRCRDYLLGEKKLMNGKMWGDDFHLYSVQWTPDRIDLLVDGELWARIDPQGRGLHDQFPLRSCPDVPHSLLEQSSKMAPFDDHFYITLGVAAGGISEFRDDIYSNGRNPKPWRNNARKASLNFWEHQDDWVPTWENPELLVDYVKVVAL